MSVDPINTHNEEGRCNFCNYKHPVHRPECPNSKKNKKALKDMEKRGEVKPGEPDGILAERIALAREKRMANIQKEKEVEALSTTLLNAVDPKTLNTAQKGALEIMQAMDYNPLTDLLGQLKKTKKQEITASKRADINLKLMEMIWPKAKELPKPKDGEGGIQVTVNAGEVE
jgi:hypothetical protein